ncbi:MAG TPA: biotin/lipoyl-containing protein [Anaerolineaceae bacterium]|nr:biotin/lipoyl-containing protein [Anaerolineaceae bacterium]
MRYRFQSTGQIYELALERQGQSLRATIDGLTSSMDILNSQEGQLTMLVRNRPVTLFWAVDGPRWWISLDGCTFCLEKPSLRRAGSAVDSGGGDMVRSPMPAQVRAVQVREGDSVEKGQTLLLLEAMKMEIRVKAPSIGLVKRLLVVENQAVEKDQLLAEIGG